MRWRLGRQVGLVDVDLPDRDEWQAQVSDPLEQAVEGCLVGDLAADDGGSVALVADGQSVEPGGPVRVEVPREPDLVAPGLGAIGCQASVVRSFRSSCVLPLDLRPAIDLSHWNTVEADVMSAHQHT